MPVNSASDAVWVLMETTSGCIGPPSQSLPCQEMALVNQNQNQNPPKAPPVRAFSDWHGLAEKSRFL